jgi:hypothetical protein
MPVDNGGTDGRLHLGLHVDDVAVASKVKDAPQREMKKQRDYRELKVW